MNRRLILPALMLVVLAAACKKEEPKAAAPAQAAPQAAAPVPAAPAQAGDAATEAHRIHISNYPKAPVTVTLNGEWVGQWDGDISNPVTAVKGKNSLLVEVGGAPNSSLTVAIEARRGGSWVPLLSFDYQGKPGKHEAAFVAK